MSDGVSTYTKEANQQTSNQSQSASQWVYYEIMIWTFLYMVCMIWEYYYRSKYDNYLGMLRFIGFNMLFLHSSRGCFEMETNSTKLSGIWNCNRRCGFGYCGKLITDDNWGY